jgi:periplasmic protein TonB
MGQILTKSSNRAIKGSEAIRTNLSREERSETTEYNRSSLAVDPKISPFGIRQAAPHLVRRPIQVSLSLKGLDELTANKDRTPNFVSFVIHVLIVTAILWLGLSVRPVIVQPVTTFTHVDFKLYDPPLPKVMPTAKVMGGGGGGGAHHLIAPTKGELPKVAKVQLMPAQLLRLEHPKLPVEPTMRVNLPDSSSPVHLGMPQSPQIVLSSQGMGSGSGFGRGLGGGIGIGQGIGSGPGNGGGAGGGVMSVGGGVSAPEVIHSVEPQFTEEARRANFEGTVAIHLIVDAQGAPQDIRVTRHLGMGLDLKAIEAVEQYRFRPAMYQGHPVAVQMMIEVAFRLH